MQPIAMLPLRITDPETSRVVAILNRQGDIIGAGCLISSTSILTCRHVVEEALDGQPLSVGVSVPAILVGTEPPTRCKATVKRWTEKSDSRIDDLAELFLEEGVEVSCLPVEFACPYRHGGKSFSALGFPQNYPHGFNARGVLYSASADKSIQVDVHSQVEIQPGFSGAPVWCPEVNAFIGILVSANQNRIAWCIPSSAIAKFLPETIVRFRMPPMDRPLINDYFNDDPNANIFGTTSKTISRKLSAKVTLEGDGEESYFCVQVRLKCKPKTDPHVGRLVTLITHPSFTGENEDAYEQFAECVNGEAEFEFQSDSSFTIAVIADAGATALTLDLSKLSKLPKGFAGD